LARANRLFFTTLYYDDDLDDNLWYHVSLL